LIIPAFFGDRCCFAVLLITITSRWWFIVATTLLECRFVHMHIMNMKEYVQSDLVQAESYLYMGHARSRWVFGVAKTHKQNTKAEANLTYALNRIELHHIELLRERA